MRGSGFRTVLAVHVVLAASPTANAKPMGYFLGGQTLYADCLVYKELESTSRKPTLIEANQDGSSRNAVIMANDGLTFMNQINEAPPYYCLPENIQTGTMVDVVFKYLEENPAKRHKAAIGIVLDALQEAYPCP